MLKLGAVEMGNTPSSLKRYLSNLHTTTSAVPPRAPAVDSTHLPASTSLLGIERFFDDNNAAGNLQGYDLVIPTSISLDNQVRCTYFNLIDSVYLLHEIYTY